MDYLLQVFKAMANERRLKMLEVLLDGKEFSIDEIASKVKIPFATCCRNLKILEKTYIVESKRREGYVFYKLNNPQNHPYNCHLIKLLKFRRKRLSKRK